MLKMQRAQNGVSMKMKANTYTTKKQIVEEMLIENYAKYYKLAYSYVRNESDAQDIVQEGAYKAILNCNSLKNDSYADTWIYRIMINEAITHFRGKKKETVGISENIKTQMKEQMAADEGIVYFFEGDDMPGDGFEQIQSDQDFYFNEDGEIVIEFDEYEVSPGYMGIVSFTIPESVTGTLLVEP